MESWYWLLQSIRHRRERGRRRYRWTWSRQCAKLGKKALIALREPSLGPCFGIKGGAAGGGYAQVVPMEDLNLHFTGDFHAITSANNLLAALLDNHIQQGNALGIDPRQVVWKRCLDMNDRVLRNVVVGLGNKMDGMVREDHFVITVASEIMAILCLADDMEDLKRTSGPNHCGIYILPENRLQQTSFMQPVQWQHC